MEKLTEELILEEVFLDMFSQRGFLSRAYNGIVDAGKFEEFYDGIVQLSAELGSALDIQVCACLSSSGFTALACAFRNLP